MRPDLPDRLAAGDEGALKYIDQLRRDHPAAADSALARLRIRQGRLEEGVQALEALFIRLQTDPWPWAPPTEHALRLVHDLGEREPALARRLFKVLQTPFSLKAMNEARIGMVLELAQHLPLEQTCREALEPMETDFPWRLDLLLYRSRCYQATKDPRAGRAQEELSRYISREPDPFDRGLSASATASPGP